MRLILATTAGLIALVGATLWAWPVLGAELGEVQTVYDEWGSAGFTEETFGSV